MADDDFTYCAALVRQWDRDRFVAALFAPQPLRGPIYALGALHIELARVREVAREPMPGEIRLQFWREVVEGGRRGEAGPLGSALSRAIDEFKLPPPLLLDMIEAHGFDLYDDPMGSLGELEGYADKTLGNLTRLTAKVLGTSPEVIDEAARCGAIAATFAGVLIDFPRAIARRQLFVPLELIERHGGRREEAFAGVATAGLVAALGELRQRAREALAKIPVTEIAPQVLPALLPVAPLGATLERMQRAAAAPFSWRPLPAWRRQWLIWRASRNPLRLVSPA